MSSTTAFLSLRLLNWVVLSCLYSITDPLEVRALIPLSRFTQDRTVSIVLYYGRNNFIGEMTVDLEDLLYSEEMESDYTVISTNTFDP